MNLFTEIKREIERADDKYGDFRSTHEGLGVLLEEVSELQDAIHRNNLYSIELEALQVAAVAIRMIDSLGNVETRARSGL